jgi:hypothetical protein
MQDTKINGKVVPVLKLLSNMLKGVQGLMGVEVKQKSKAIPVTGRAGLQGCEMLRIPHCKDNRLTFICNL